MSDPRDNTINYVEFPVRDPAATRKFFESVFGWQFTDWGSDYMSFRDGRMDGGFYRAEATARVETGSALCVLYHSDIEGCLEKVVEAGGAVSKDIFSFPGGRRFHFLEPSGNELAVWSEPVEAS